MEQHIEQIITTVQIALLVLAVPAVGLLMAWRDLLEAKEVKELQAAEAEHVECVLSMLRHDVLDDKEAKSLLLEDGGGDD